MKTTLELPDDLFTEVKVRAARERRKFKDAMADYLRRGLAATDDLLPATPILTTNPITGLPMAACTLKPVGEPPTPDQIKDILLEQEIEWALEAGR